MSLADALARRLASLLPPERQPKAGGAADQLVSLLGTHEEQRAREAMGLISEWLALTSDEAGVELLGKGRYLRRFPGEPTETYRDRVMGAFAYWEMAGTLPGVRLALLQAGYQAVVIEHFHENRACWAEFSVTVGPAQPLRPDAHWGGDAWAAGSSWGFRLPAVPLDWLPDLIREVKPAHARLRRLTWSPRGRSWGGGVAWGEDREPPAAPAPGWGIESGFAGYTPTPDRTDSGPAWGETDDEIIYQYPGAPDA